MNQLRMTYSPFPNVIPDLVPGIQRTTSAGSSDEMMDPGGEHRDEFHSCAAM